MKAPKADFYAQDVFEFLREKPLDYNLVILDPPAFAKRKTECYPGLPRLQGFEPPGL